MKLIISPAKQMRINNDFMEAVCLPGMLDKTEYIMNRMREFSQSELKKIWLIQVLRFQIWHRRCSRMRSGSMPDGI